MILCEQLTVPEFSFSNWLQFSGDTTMSDSRMEVKLKNTPEDCIQNVKFGPTSSQFLLVASWDKTVRLYDVMNNTMRIQYQHTNSVLDCCFQVSLPSAELCGGPPRLAVMVLRFQTTTVVWKTQKGYSLNTLQYTVHVLLYTTSHNSQVPLDAEFFSSRRPFQLPGNGGLVLSQYKPNFIFMKSSYNFIQSSAI